MADIEIKNIIQEWTEAKNEWQDWFYECEEDYQFALGDQWDDADKDKLTREKRPVLSLNMIKKPIDLITGYERQNRTDLRVVPIEGSDQMIADVLSEAIKWIISNRSQEHNISMAFHDAVIGGLGWIHPCVDYTEDFIEGDIKIRTESPFRITPDPEMTEMDLSDCNYIFRHAWVSKESAKAMYPDFAADIDKMSGGDTSPFDIQMPLSMTNKSHVNIVEKWYRVYEKQKFLVDGVNVYAIEKGKEQRVNEMMQMPEFAHMEIIERKVPRIKLYTLCGEDIILFDDYNPYNTSMYPFVPIFGYFLPHFNDWKFKLMGLTRVLKDVQREKNKRRSQLLHAALTVPLSGFFVEKGAVDNPESLVNSAGAGKSIQVNDISKIKQIQAQEIPQSLVKLEQMLDNDIIAMSVNPDLLGMIGHGSSGASAPGITLQLRQRQGLVAVQNLFDNHSHGKKLLGRLLIDMIINNFSEQKLSRILGRDVPPGFIDSIRNSRFDVAIDEVVNSPTYRMNTFSILATLMQNGFPVQPETLVKWSDFPQSLKDDLGRDIQTMRQMQGQPPPQGGAPPGSPIQAGAMSDVPMGDPRKGVDIAAYGT